MSQNLYLIAKGITKAFPIHFTSNPVFGSPHKRTKYPDKRRIFPMYLNTLVFFIKGVFHHRPGQSFKSTPRLMYNAYKHQDYQDPTNGHIGGLP